MVAAMGKVSRKWNPYAAIGVGGLRRGHRLWGIVGRLGSWLGREVGRERPQRELRRLALDGDGKRDGPQLGLKGDVGVGRLGPRLGLDSGIGRDGQPPSFSNTGKFYLNSGPRFNSVGKSSQGGKLRFRAQQ